VRSLVSHVLMPVTGPQFLGFVNQPISDRCDTGAGVTPPQQYRRLADDGASRPRPGLDDKLLRGRAKMNQPSKGVERMDNQAIGDLHPRRWTQVSRRSRLRATHSRGVSRRHGHRA
jgi:hypothetical protein